MNNGEKRDLGGCWSVWRLARRLETSTTSTIPQAADECEDDQQVKKNGPCHVGDAGHQERADVLDVERGGLLKRRVNRLDLHALRTVFVLGFQA